MKFLDTFKKRNKIDNDIIIEQSDKNVVCDNTTQIENNRNILRFLSENITDAITNDKKPLSSNMSDELESIFGKQNLSMRLEYNTKIWILDAYNLEFILFCSKRGTDIAICESLENISQGENEKEIISFISKIYELINNL